MISGHFTRRFLRLLPALVVFLLLLPAALIGQGSSSERVYQKPALDVHKALQQLRSSLGGRLPVLDGFVDSDQPLDNYSRGYYQCSVQVMPATSGGTMVRVKAKITAWYAGSNATQAGYRALPSNGRLEADLLSRLDDAIAGTASAQAQISPGAQASPASTPASTAVPESNRAAVPEPETAAALNNSSPAMVGTAPPSSMPGRFTIPPYNPADSAYSSSASEDLLSPREKLEEAEQRKDLRADIQSLEEIRSNQVHPTNLAVVKRAGTPVQSMPAPSAPMMFEADAGDEFEILDEQENWVHVRIAGQSRGWIRSAELDLPVDAEPAKTTDAETPAFQVSREETKPFPGPWEPLHGKTVRIIWVEPASGSATSSPNAKRLFAKSVFAKAYKQIASGSQPVAGVVIVFDSADGGQISATLSTLEQWQAGSLSERSFWKRCVLDPSDFLEPSKSAGS